jgi:hypothetical protein
MLSIIDVRPIFTTELGSRLWIGIDADGEPLDSGADSGARGSTGWGLRRGRS